MAKVHTERLDALRRRLQTTELDAWLMHTSDPHLSEYVPEHWQSIEWLTGFTGSHALVCVTAHDAALFTDSRYWEQAEAQLAETPFVLVKEGHPNAPTVQEWFLANLPDNSRIGLADDLWSIRTFRHFRETLAPEGRTLVPTRDLTDALWTVDRPTIPRGAIQPMALPLSRVPGKLASLREAVSKLKADAVCLSALDDIAWLTDCRGNDIAYNPVFLSFMIVTAIEARLYTEASRIDDKLGEALANAGITRCDPDTLSNDLRRLSGTKTFLIDPSQVSVRLFDTLTRPPVEAPSPVTRLKGRKSTDECNGIREAMRSDGVALVEFYADLDERLTRGESLTEIDVANMIDAARARRPDNLGNSFATISAFGPNAALPHYTPTPDHAATLSDGLLLVDSGGQYLTGTTDITRMTAVGDVSDAMRRDVTYVLKGMIALASAKVPEGTSGAQLDALARAPLWSQGLDFGHGTGHGVGCRLNVHEGPFHISPRASARGEDGLQIGRLVSDEPGVYRPGAWGVRIENLILARPSEHSDFGRFIEFEVMTLCPIDLRTIDKSLLTPEEAEWLDRYHTHVRQVLGDMPLSPRAHQWLEARTQSISET